MNLNTVYEELHHEDVFVESLILDSRTETKNGMFFCIKGLNVDGHDFIDQAIAKGCTVIVHEDDIETYDDDITYIQVGDSMGELHKITNIFFDNPSKKLVVHGITGTNGKSTIMKTLKNMLQKLGVNTGYIGTISVEYNDLVLSPSLTTPDIIELQGILNDMVMGGVKEVCLEVSSQGLALRRVDGIHFNDASFTNLSHDHLDYHKDMNQYFEAKKVLFDRLSDDAFTIINMDDDYGKKLIEEGYPHLKTYGMNDSADYCAKNIRLSSNGTEFTLVYEEEEYEVQSNFVAMFNVYNILNVIAILHQRNYTLEEIIPHFKDIEHVDGRLTVVDEGQDFQVFVDFGHAPDSMKNVYEYVRSITKPENKIITVFGAAGARDHLKRPIMGRVASELCDWVILTEHDNRNESIETITKEIITGIKKENYEFVLNRYQAIFKAISMANPGDSVVLQGKGEEKFIYREFGKEKWMGDEVCAAEIIKKIEKGELYEQVY